MVTFAKISPKLANPRGIAGNAEKEEDEPQSVAWPRDMMCVACVNTRYSPSAIIVSTLGIHHQLSLCQH